MKKVLSSRWNRTLKGETSKTIRVATLLVAAMVLPVNGVLAAPANPPATNAVPTGGVVSAGTAAIGQGGTTAAPVLNVNQSSQRAAINWGTFNVGQASTVNFNQPNAQSVTLNRVLDSTPSQIFGKINAPGQVYLVNPSGVYFGRSASVDVGGLVATTHGMSDAYFMAGGNRFNREGATGRVENEGELKAKLDGYIALLAPEVVNGGVIVAERGTAVLANGESITLDFNAGGRLTGIVVTASDIATLIENKQAIETDDGQIIISAQSVSALRGSVIKNSGSLKANTGASSITRKGGRILLEGDDIALSSTSQVEAKGEQGGGTVLVGGEWQGGNGVYQATKTAMAAGATIDASATLNGDGGKVVLWSDIHAPLSMTTAFGTLKAEGGALGGNGGQIETSGHFLAVDGMVVSARAPLGKAGQWLLDPYDITITGADNNSTNANGTFTGSAVAVTINAATIVAALASSDVTISTAGAGAQAGNITLAYGNSITSGSSNKLTLNAAGGIVLNDTITRSGTGALDLTSGTGGLTIGNVSSSTAAINMSGGAAVTVTQGGYSNFAGTFTGSGSLIKEGAGTLDLNYANQNYTGSTIIRGGTLKVHRTPTMAGVFNSSDVVVNAGATLELIGSFNQLDQAITLNGSGVGGNGALVVNMDYRLLGRVTLGSDASIGGSAGLVLDGGLAGSNTLTKIGGGYVKLNTDNSATFTGAMKLNAGTISVGHSGGMGSGGAIVFGGGALQYGASGLADFSPRFSTAANQPYIVDTNGNNATWAAPLTSAGGSLRKTGSGTLTLSAGNTYAGTTTVSAGTLSVTGSLSDVTAVTVASGATYGVDAADTIGSLAGAGNIALNASLTTGGDGTSTTFSGVISGASSLTKTGVATLTLSGSASTYTGSTIVSEGILSVITLANGGSNSGLGASSNAATNLVFDGGTLAYSGASAATDRNFTINAGKTASISVTNAANTLTLNGTAGQDGALSKLGAGTLKLAAANPYGVAISVSTGVLQVGDATALGTGLVTVQTGAGLDVNGITMTGSVGLVMNGTGVSNGGALYNGSATSATFAGNIMLAGDTAFKVGNGPLVLSGAISGTYALTKLGAGTLTLGGPSTYSGVTMVAEGTLAVSHVDGLGTTAGGTSVASGAVLELQGVTLPEGITMNGGTLSVSAGSSTLSGTVSLAANSTLNVAGSQLTLSGDVSGGSGFTKTGAGTLLLSGNNTYSGTSTISAGVLKLGSVSALGATSGGTTISSGAAIDLNGQTYSAAEGLTMTGTGVSGGGALCNDSATAATFGGLINLPTSGTDTSIVASAGDITISNVGSITGASAARLILGGAANGILNSVLATTAAANGPGALLTKTGTGTWTLTASNTFNGGTNPTAISNGILKVGNALALGQSTNGNSIRISPGGSLDVNGLAFTPGGTGYTYLSGSGYNGAGVILNSSATGGSYAGRLVLEGNVQLGGSTGVITFGNINSTSLGAYELTLAGSSGGTFAGGLTGAGSLRKIDAGTWTMTNQVTGSSYSGATTISGGTLVIKSSSALGGTGAGTTIDSGATLQVESNFGTGYSAEPITLNGGTLTVVTESATKLTGAVTLTADSFVSASSAKTLELTGVVSGAFGLKKSGDGTAKLSGANTYSGATTVNAGFLQLGSAAALGATSQVSIDAVATLDLNGNSTSANLVLNGSGVSGAGNIVSKAGSAATVSGTVTLNAAAAVGGTKEITFSGVVTANNYQLNIVGLNNILFTNANNTISKIAASSGTASYVNGLTVNTLSDLTFGSVNGFQGVYASGNIVLNSAGAVTLASGDQVKLYAFAYPAAGLAIKAARFVNNAGATALVVNKGYGQEWTVWSTNADPYGASTPDVVGGLAYDYKQYNLTGSGIKTDKGYLNGLVYAYAPLISGTIGGTISKVYDNTTAVTGSGLTLTGISGNVGGDVYAGSLGTIGGLTFDTKDVGTGKTINGTITGLDGAFTSNSKPVYGYGFSGSLSATGTITPKSLTLFGLSVSSKTYDSTTAATVVGTAVLTGSGATNSADGKYYSTDAVSLVAGPVSGTFATAAAGASKSVSLTGSLSLAGADMGNYSLTLPALTANINKKVLFVDNLSAPNKVYDGTTAATIVTSGSFSLTAGAASAMDGKYYVGDTVTVPAAGTVTGSYGSANAGPGGVTLSGLTLSGAAAGNYVLMSPSTITPATLTYAATPATSTYGSTPGANSGTVVGFVAGQTQAGATTGTLSFTNGATAASGAGSYAITGGGLTANNGNYVFVQAAANATALTIRPASLNVSVTKVYDGSDAFSTGLTVSGSTFNGDAMPGVTGGTATVSSRNVNVYGSFASNTLTLSNPNYTLVGGTVSASITARPLTVSADAKSVTYGANALPGLTYGSSGLVPGDSFSGSLATTARAYDGTTAGSGSNAGTYDITQGSLSAGANYNVSFTAASLTVTPAALTYAAGAMTSAYGQVPVVGAGTLSGLVNGDTQAGVTTGSMTYATTATATSGVGSYAVTGSGLTANSNYTLAQAAANATALTITPATLTVSVDVKSMTYGGNALPALTYASHGLVNGDAFSGSLTTSATAYDGTTAGSGSNTGTYAITQGTLSAGANYSIVFTGANLTVTPATLTYVAGTISSVYGQTPVVSPGSLSGLVNGDTQAGVTTGSMTYATTATATSGVGSYAVTGSGLTANSNYVLAQASANATALTITPAALTVTAQSKSMTYGGNVLPGLTYSSSGLVNGDGFSGALTTTATAFDGTAGSGSDAGTYAITQGTLSAGGNYAISYTGANLTVNKAQLTATGNSPSMTYGANALPVLVANYTGFVNGDTNVAGLVGTPSVSTTATAYNGTAGSASNVGSYAVSVSVSGLSSTNYTFVPGSNGTLTVTRAPITVGSLAVSGKTYDGNTTAVIDLSGATYAGLLAGDSVSVNVTGANFASANAGTHAVNLASTVTGAQAGNYTVTAPGSLTGTISPAALTVTADAKSVTYGANAIPSLTYVSAGFVNNETSSLFSGVLATTATAFNGTAGSGSDAGTYAITQGTLSAGGNYAISYTGANLTVNKAQLTATGNSPTMTYGDNSLPALSASYSGFVNGDSSVSGLVGSPTVSTTATAYNGTAGSASDVGTYAVTVSVAGVSSINYTFVKTDGTLTVNRAPVTVGGLAVSGKTYDGSTTAAIDLSGATYSGLLAGDIVSVAVTGANFASANAGTHAVNLTSTVTGAQAGNYVVTAPGSLTGTISPATLTVTAQSKSMTYGGNALPGLTYISTGFVNGETASLISGALATTATAFDGNAGSGSDAGTYAITQGTLSAGGNYAISYTGANLTVNKAQLTATGNSPSMTYGANALPALSANYTGFVNGDTNVAGLVGTPSVSTTATPYDGTAGSASNVGTYPVSVSVAGMSSTNYAFVPGSNGTLTVNRAPITVGSLAVSGKTYDGTTTAVIDLSGATYAGLLAGDVVGVSVTGANFASANAGTHAVNLTSLVTGAQAGNYIVTAPGSLTGTISPASLTVTADAKTMTYGANALPALTYATTGLVSDEALSGALSTLATAFNGTAGSGSSVGLYSIALGTLSAGGNYTLNFVGANLTVTPALLTYAATPSRVVFGTTPPVVGGTLTGLVNGDTESSATTGSLTFTTTATATSPVGSYAVTGSGLTANSNYTLAQAAGNSSAITITPVPAVDNVAAALATSTAATLPQGANLAAMAGSSTTGSPVIAPITVAASALDLGGFRIIGVTQAGQLDVVFVPNPAQPQLIIPVVQLPLTTGQGAVPDSLVSQLYLDAGLVAPVSAGTATVGSGAAAAGTTGTSGASVPAGSAATTSTTEEQKKNNVRVEQTQITTVLANDAPLPTQLTFNPEDKTFALAKGADLKLPLQVKIQLRQGGSVVSEKLVMLTNEF